MREHLERHRPQFILFQCGADSWRGPDAPPSARRPMRMRRGDWCDRLRACAGWHGRRWLQPGQSRPRPASRPLSRRPERALRTSGRPDPVSQCKDSPCSVEILPPFDPSSRAMDVAPRREHLGFARLNYAARACWRPVFVRLSTLRVPGKRYYGGRIRRCCRAAGHRPRLLFGAAAANVQPHSGSQANAAVTRCSRATLLGMSLIT